MKAKRKSRSRGLIVGRTNPKIQNCPTCGWMRVHHPAGYYTCPTPPEVIAALKEFKAKNGKRWKSILCAMWERAEGSAELQQARNMIGPRRLYNLEL